MFFKRIILTGAGVDPVELPSHCNTEINKGVRVRKKGTGIRTEFQGILHCILFRPLFSVLQGPTGIQNVH